MYFLLIRPQRRRMREQQAMQKSLEVGDEVMTSIRHLRVHHGFEDDIVWVEIDDDVQIRVNRGFLQGKVHTGETAPAAEPPPVAAGPAETRQGHADREGRQGREGRAGQR